MSKTISILGAGWLGLPLGKFLVEKGYDVKGSTTSESKLKVIDAAGVQPFLLSVEGKQIQGENVATFFDTDILIVNIPPGRRNPDIETIYPHQIATILDSVKQSKIIFTSSTGVYGDENTIVTEQTPLHPTRRSGKALAKAETLIRNSELNWIILRLAGLVGEDRKPGKFLAGKKGLTNGNAHVNLVHRQDCIQVIHQLLQSDHWNEVFNVCADKHPQKEVYYIQQAIKEGLEPPTFVDSSEQSFKIVSNQKIKQFLHYSFLFPNPMQFP